MVPSAAPRAAATGRGRAYPGAVPRGAGRGGCVPGPIGRRGKGRSGGEVDGGVRAVAEGSGLGRGRAGREQGVQALHHAAEVGLLHAPLPPRVPRLPRSVRVRPGVQLRDGLPRRLLRRALLPC